MFGGYGLFLEGTFFGVISDGRIYFRTDAASRRDYLDRGMAPFRPPNRPRGPKTVDRNFEVPRDVLADVDLLREWALRAASVSSRLSRDTRTRALLPKLRSLLRRLVT